MCGVAQPGPGSEAEQLNASDYQTSCMTPLADAPLKLARFADRIALSVPTPDHTMRCEEDDPWRGLLSHPSPGGVKNPELPRPPLIYNWPPDGAQQEEIDEH